jgi:hypothetical protein
MRFITLFAPLALAIHAPAQVLTAGNTLSGSGAGVAPAVAFDSQGNVFVAGTTTSPDFPIVNGLISHVPDGGQMSSCFPAVVVAQQVVFFR